MIRYTKAKLSDIALMQEVVRLEVEKGIILFRSADEMSTNIRSYILAKEDDEIIGFGALHFHAPDLAEIRSLIVKEGYRGKGIGRGIIENLLTEGEFLGVKKVFTLTYQKGFFETLGFSEIPKEALPSHKIWADCIKCKHFPICDEIALIKHI
ncbi:MULTISPECIES: N-acetyltransferase [Sulfurospirillum]|jgi:amino-acid N-acetyltransferase|uniref:GNAT family N-acetyltransferase n=1 Tax=Sulfurospirillum cavolei TaxID=366522 RepID=A0A2D3WBQ0_9BACT|nr:MULTISPECIES: N-acetyltransferase [Sulfurospirillum]KHG32932.1 MAG: acetyltransferase [Sulfurospirillum sp. MES]MCD8544202.1 N-acetyltransferase [Sulfurospirillum cavolei]MCP3651791.1 N-acetyltransferase [Sulfurospirillum sp. DNRA8]MCR1810638.1 N-acetyltransferase [Sulfurospirillum sp. DNRA8]MDY0265505.1 N-acetyltransferase [Sulfurospirillum cavolei]